MNLQSSWVRGVFSFHTSDFCLEFVPTKYHSLKKYAALQNDLNDQLFLLIMRASHVIKGASSNLMCQQLRLGATNLEQSAAAANEISLEDAALEASLEGVKEKYAELKKAVDEFHKFLESADIE